MYLDWVMSCMGFIQLCSWVVVFFNHLIANCGNILVQIQSDLEVFPILIGI